MATTKKYILAIDEGTTGVTALLIDRKLEVKGRGYRDFAQVYPQPGWVEHDPEAIWGATRVAVQKALASGGIGAGEIAAIGITNQRETTVLWHRATGKPIHNAIVWQCRRTADVCEKLKAKGYEALVRKKAGLVLDPYFSATKIAWQLDHVKGARREAEKGDIAFGTIDTFLVSRLTGFLQHVTEPSNASRTLLYNIHRRRWDEELCGLFEVPQAVLPFVVPSAGQFGVTKGVGFLPDGIPVTGVAGDQQAALFGQACFEVGEAKCTYGTGAFMLMNTGSKPITSKAGLLTSAGWQVEDDFTYVLEGSAFIAGAAVQWLRDELGFIRKSSEVETLARTVEGSGGVMFVPALTGLGAPHWRADARGVLLGLTRGTNRAHVAYAVLEGIAAQNAEILLAMQRDARRELPVLKVDGGASANNLLMQMQADILGVPISRPAMIETTALGAACLAGLGSGFFASKEQIRATWKEDARFEPTTTAASRRAFVKRWQAAVAKA